MEVQVGSIRAHRADGAIPVLEGFGMGSSRTRSRGSKIQFVAKLQNQQVARLHAQSRRTISFSIDIAELSTTLRIKRIAQKQFELQSTVMAA